MLTLIHGDDIVTSRKAVSDLKLKYEKHEKIFFDGAKITFTDIVSAFDSLSLFGLQKLIIVENFFFGPMSKEKEVILQFLKESKSLTEVIFWEQRELTKPILKKYFLKAKVIFCQLPQVLFKFLDSIGEAPLPQILSTFYNLSDVREAEFILSMLVRQWRNLIIAADLGDAGFAGLPSWQAYKFSRQARFFNIKNLTSSYRQLLLLDLKVKTGLTPYTLKQLLDIFFVSLYYQD